MNTTRVFLRRLIGPAILLAVVMTIGSCGKGPKPPLELLEWKLKPNEMTKILYLEGKVKNNTGATVSTARIKFDLLDGNGNAVGTSEAVCMDLAEDGIWNFRDLVGNEAVKSVRLVELKIE